MHELSYTLLSDGPADRVLIPILTWLLRQHFSGTPIQSRWADLRPLPNPPSALYERIQVCIELFRCDLMFIHRDAETVSLVDRLNEIGNAVSQAARTSASLPHCIGVVPVRMTEAWLLFDTTAIRHAAGNPNGAIVLDLPQLVSLEHLPDPKDILRRLILSATELGANRRRCFNVASAIQRIPEYIDDFSILRTLSAFSNLETRLRPIVADLTTQP